MELTTIIWFCFTIYSTLINSGAVDIRSFEMVTPSHQLVENSNLVFSTHTVQQIDILASGVVQVNDKGIAILQQTVNNSDGVIWLADTSRYMKNPDVQLLDTGNLVIRDEDSHTNNIKDFIWQSFDHPGDNLLPGMKIGIDLVTGLDRHITSWKSVDDPSPEKWNAADWSNGCIHRTNLVCGTEEGFVKYSGVKLPDTHHSWLHQELLGNETEANTSRVVGTYGYMSPKYAIEGQFSVKSDVFSFGVLLIEIVSGMKNRLFCHRDHNLNLLGHARMSYKEDKLLQLIDGVILDSSSHIEVFRVVRIGLLCVQQDRKDRPVMSQVVLMLNSNMKLPHPKQPGFFMERNLLESDHLSSDPNLSSSNELTVTALLPRQ
ncbi:Bulb-type lectin domain-containing protein [Heracleum sosnowskyi]|uniref:Bulb-type lectin domain-containing protein n=1 Tax=Heracleum sosnowskyi TaxID=360622 RepID=A0AAD8N560_9APIA|nr:Bulb-type lectin domain-containing protein [Heracleum sosnowskyi]